jgi:flagellar basal-body rod protein FlgC
MFEALDISVSGLVSQRERMTTISGNLANFQTILDEQGAYAPYQRRIPILAAGDPSTGSPLGVHVAEIALDEGDLIQRYEPDNPYADAAGYVGYPNINVTTELMNAMEAARAYEANITASEATKSMYSIALELLG